MQALTVTAWLRWGSLRGLLPRDAQTLLEIGAGLGGTGVMLSRRYAYTGLEPDAVSYATAARRTGGKVLQQRLEDHAGIYDIVCAFEVLEHIEDDVAALRRWREHSNRWLLLSVPMNPDRFGPADERVGHYRRYTRGSLIEALSTAGWKPTAIRTYGFPAGYVLDATRQVLAARSAKPEARLERTNASGRWLQPGAVAAPLTWSVALPFRALQSPFRHGDLGTGLVALAHR
jgi:hypothetical protein